MSLQTARGEQTTAMQAAVLQQLSGIDSVELSERPVPPPATGQALIRVYAAGVGPWDVGFLDGAFPGLRCRSSRGKKSPAWSKQSARRPASSPVSGIRESVPHGWRICRAGA